MDVLDNVELTRTAGGVSTIIEDREEVLSGWWLKEAVYQTSNGENALGALSDTDAQPSRHRCDYGGNVSAQPIRHCDVTIKLLMWTIH